MGFSYNVSVLNQKGSPALYTDTFANRPAFGYAGRLFIANDTSAIYEDTGTAWVLIANVSSGAGTLQQVTTNGNTSNVGISVTAGGISTNSLTDTALTLGSVLFAGAAGLVTQDNAAFYWDDTNNRLGINTTTPTNTLDLHFAGTGAMLGLNNTAGNQSAIVFANTGTNKWRIGNSATNSFDIYNSTLASIAFQLSNADNRVDIDGNVFLQKSLALKTGSSNVSAAGYTLIHSLSGTGLEGIQLSLSTGGFASLLFNSSNNRQFTFPNADGTVALTADLASYLPLAGGTLTGTLNAVNISQTGNLDILGGGLSGTNGLHIWFNTSTNVCWIQGFQAGVDWRQINYNGAIHNFLINDVSAMYVSNGRNVLIGSTTDDTVNKLQVTGSAKITSTLTMSRPASGITLISLEGSSAYGDTSNIRFCDSRAYIKSTILVSAAGDTDLSFATQVSGTVAERFYVNASGSFKINNLAGTGSRAVLADSTGVLSAPVSDQLVKQNIEPLKYGLETILKLNAVQFEFIDGYKNYGEGLQIGTIAQEVEQIIPEAVFTTPSTGLKGINYNQFDGIYIKAIQDLNNIIDGLLKRIELLENK